MNKKGFTLVELLATIIILGLLTLLASTSVTKVLKESKGDLYTTQIKLVESAAEAWGAENIDKLPNDGECKFLTVETLQDYGLIDKDITNPKTNEKIDNNIKIKISSSKTGYGNSVTNYEVNPKSIEGCSHAMPCTLINGEPNEIGSKYECEVKLDTKYNFYVLSYNDINNESTNDKTQAISTNLIMDQNINSDGTPAGMTGTIKNGENVYNLVAWNNESGQSTNAHGPVTATKFLYNATRDWVNVSAINYIYNDRKYQKIPESNTTIGYNSFISTNGVATITSLSGNAITIGSESTPLRARMPIYVSDVNITEITSKTNSPFLYDNLDSTGSKAPYGYWTFSSRMDFSNLAWYARYHGEAAGTTDVNYPDYFGVRPVINLKI